MELTASERQQQFLKLAATHAEDFKTRVVQHDRENSFPFENVEAMKASGYTNLTVPVELGGGGATPGEWPGFVRLPVLIVARHEGREAQGATGS